MMTMNTTNLYGAAMTALKAGNHTGAMSNLLELLEVERNPGTRVAALIAAAELDIVHFKRTAGPNKHLTEVRTILAAQTHLPAVYGAHCDTLEGQRLIKNHEYGPALDALRTAVFAYRAAGDKVNAVNGEMLIASCLLAYGTPADALTVCREVRMNPACAPRLFELNVLQAKVAAAMGDDAEKRRLVRNAVEGLRTRLGDADFRTLAEVMTVAGVDFGKVVPVVAYVGTNPFPLSLSVVR